MLIPFDKLFKDYKVKTSGILHLGANSGQEADAYDALAVPRVIWVEALPDKSRELLFHIAHRPGHVALVGCVSSEDDKDVTFNVSSNDAQSSSILELGTHKVEHPSVTYVAQHVMKTVTVPTLLRRHGITIEGDDWLLNADLQGAELLAIKGMGELIRQFKYAYLEVNSRPLYVGCPLVEEIDAYLHRFGFEPKATHWTRHGWGDKFYMRK